MEVGKLTVELRSGTGKGVSRTLRAQGKVPGVCYGVGLDQPLPITVDPKALRASLDPDKKRNTVINLTVADAGKQVKSVTAMLWEYQVHPLKQNVTHVDLIAIDPAKPIALEIPIKLVGKHAGAIDGGILSFERRSVNVHCVPAAIPSSLELDISPLHIGEALHISDIPLPEGVSFDDSPKLTVVTCVAPKADKTATVEAEEGAEGEAAVAAEGAEGDEEKKEEAKKD